MDILHGKETSRKDPPLQCKGSCHDTWYCPSAHHRLGWWATEAGTPVGEPGVESRLPASSDEANCAAVAGAETSMDPEASSDHETPKELDAPSSCVADLEGVPVSMRFSSDWEAVTTSNANFLGVALIARATCAGVVVPGARTRDHAHHQSLLPVVKTGLYTLNAHVLKFDLVLVPLEIVPVKNHY